jgi:hypothetical protein
MVSRRAKALITEIKERPWCNLTDSGDFLESNCDRMSVNIKQDNSESWRFVIGKVITEDMVVYGSTDDEAPTEDMPWGNSRGLITSTRLRALIESIAPKQAQFVPVVITNAHSGLQVLHDEQYWMINALHCVDLTDYELSEYTLHNEAGGRKRYSFDKHVIDVRKIPPGIFLVRDCNFAISLLVHAVLRDAILDAKISGCQFYPVYLSHFDGAD